MTTRKRKKRVKADRKARNRGKGDIGKEAPQPSVAQIEGGDVAKATAVQAAEDKRPSFADAVRVTGIVPIALLVVALGSYGYWPWHTPVWFQSIVEMEVAVLTLSAGHLAIIGLLINNKGGFKLGSLALYIAGVATAFAGIRGIGDSTPGKLVLLMLILSSVPAIWAEAVSTNLQRFWRYIRTWQGIICILLWIGAVIAIQITIFFQSRDEDYIRNWILIPLAILFGALAGLAITWHLLKLCYKYIPVLYSRFKARTAATRKKVASRRGKRRRRP